MKRIAVISVLLFLGFVLCCGLFPLAEVPLLLVVGWAIFLTHTVKETSVEPVAITVAGGALLVATGVFHFLARWLYDQRAAVPEPSPRSWRWRWTLSSVLLIVLVFAAGIALIATVHETGWLLRSSEPWFVLQGKAAYRAQSFNNLKQIGMAVDNFYDAYGRFPPGGTFNEYGEMLHSWETLLLPYLEEKPVPNPNLPWYHPENATFFQRRLAAFENPGVLRFVSNAEPTRTDPQGFGLSHYAANGRVLHNKSAFRNEDVTDGTSHTILAGEVTANFKPWGNPVNWRDPANGVQKSPDGFGGPWNGGLTHFLMMDGSVHAIAADVDPKVLNALATPAGGEALPPDWKGY